MKALFLLAMILSELRLVNFKNYEQLKVNFSPELNCFVGRNGMGKTNLLEAVYYMCMTKTCMGVNDRQVVKQKADFFRIQGTTQKGEKIVAKVIPGKQKQFEKNNVPYAKLSEHIGNIPVVMIVPDDTQLASEGSEARRKFIDNTLSQIDPFYLNHLMVYNKLLKQRNSALKEMWKGGYFDEALIRVYNQQLLAPADYIFEKRVQFATWITPFFEEYYSIISNRAEEVKCFYTSKLSETPYSELLEQSMEKDRILQRTTTGIHRDDLKFVISEKPLKQFASQGQLKSFVLALKLAQFELLKAQKQEMPLLLLDDIFDKLDKHRVEQLIGLLSEKEFGQVFITDTHENRLEQIVAKYPTDYRKFTVEHGQITRINQL